MHATAIMRCSLSNIISIKIVDDISKLTHRYKSITAVLGILPVLLRFRVIINAQKLGDMYSTRTSTGAVPVDYVQVLYVPAYVYRYRNSYCRATVDYSMILIVKYLYSYSIRVQDEYCISSLPGTVRVQVYRYVR